MSRLQDQQAARRQTVARIVVLSDFHLRYDLIAQALSNLGYVICPTTCNSFNFGLPQMRPRAWVLAVLRDEMRTPSDVASFMDAFRCQPLPLAVCVRAKPAHQEPESRRKQARLDPKAKWRQAYTEFAAQLGEVPAACFVSF